MHSSTFSNQLIDSQTLPDLELLPKQPLSSRYAKTNMVVILVSTILTILVVLAVKYQPFLEIPAHITNLLGFAIWLIAALGFIMIVYRRLADPLKSYALREHDLSYSAGLVFKKTVTQPIVRIQHIELKRGPIERKVGLATIQVFSAGGALETFQIPGLPLAQAQKLREFILRHKGSIEHA
ncbi:PH domain-containing protein [Colwellia sp. D2M02]|uniref:PH domain-containing protein n=1 Tax=Colwellia sp. D2M02 TaxID=2841562 RepID=UPI001C0896E1|nr:PH domain-containing protein [Colwellia sp. D2M02]MBU2892755.1 PH domain-containing protein [Colwellia sp. D2M02]